MSQRSQKSLRHPGTIWWWNSGHSDLSKPFHNKGQRNYNTCKRYSDQEQQPKSPHRDTTTRMHKRALTCYILVKIYLLRKSQTRLNLVSRIIIFRESFAHFRKARQKYSAHSEYFKDDTDTKETIYTQHYLWSHKYHRVEKRTTTTTTKTRIK